VTFGSTSPPVSRKSLKLNLSWVISVMRQPSI
jgi:hypothetical protein